MRDPIPKKQSSVIRVLLAEDDDDLRFILTRVLTSKGFQVEVVRDGPSLTAKLAQIANHPRGEKNVDAVVSDIYLPGCTAMDALEEFQDSLSCLVLILISSAPAPEVIARARDLGVKQVLSKPFDLNELARSIRKHVKEVPILK